MSTAQQPPNGQLNDFRVFLKQELDRRCQKNSQFSLRGFARLLDIEPSSLSKILNGKRRVTLSMLHRLSARLNLSEDEIKSFEQSAYNQKSLDSNHH